MAKNDTKVTDNPKLKEKTLSDGQISLYLEYYLGYSKQYDEEKDKEAVKIIRKKEFLNLYIWQAPRTPLERQQNKETLELAKKIRFEREQEMKAGKLGYRLEKKDNVNFLDYFQNYIDNYQKKDVRVIMMALAKFKAFLAKKHPVYANFIKPNNLNRDLMLEFVEYLQSICVGEGAHTIFQRFKKVVKYAEEHDVLHKNPCNGITCKIDDQVIKKDILSLEEIENLLNTRYQGENPEIRKAFIFCLYTGIRFCDVVELKFSNVDYSNRLLSFEQNKTSGHSKASNVVIPLNDGLISLIGHPSSPDNMDEVIFKLPSHTMCLKALRHWTARAGITKHITWHCARHSFAVNILNNGANIKTVASLLGHSGLKHTEKYTRAVDKLKEDAINSLPELKI
ncbi:site-specific integrase [Butyricimonas virosa]|uniref:site-specific integrase n=1 Tax=Butyricimonas virosa TaxID=544645 RepID=UPI00241C328A|nr:site-specific integrase [Butyricimonas virosa]